MPSIVPPTLTLMEQPHRARDTIRTVSVDRFYEVRGAGAGATAGQIIAMAEGLQFPKIGDTSDHTGSVELNGQSQPCFDRGLVTLLGPNAVDGTQGAILYARYGFLGGGGGGTVTNQASATSVREESFTQPVFYNDSEGYFQVDFRTQRFFSSVVYSGIVAGPFSADEVRGEITRYSGDFLNIRFAQQNEPDIIISHLFRGARLDDKPGSSLRYAAVFTSSSQVLGINGADIGDAAAITPDNLNHLEEYYVRPSRAFAPPLVGTRSVEQMYLKVPDDKLLWVSGLNRA